MKKGVTIIISIVFLLILINFMIKIFSKGHNIEYNLKDKKITFKINEKLIRNTKNERNTYNLKIKTPTATFYYQIDNDFKNTKIIIKKMKYYKDNHYECLLPIFKGDKVLTDVICKTSDQYYNYTDIIGKNEKIDKFVNNIREYNSNNFKDKSDKKEIKNNIIIYNNIQSIKNKIILDNYKGIYILDNQEIEDIKLFSKDIYKKYIKVLNDKYYLIADYNNQYEFHKFYLINIVNGDKTIIESNQAISFDSYIQGNYEDSTYLFDKNNKVQYEINIKNKTIKKIGDLENGIKIYTLNKWNTTDVYKASQSEIKFNYYKQESKDKYYEIDKVGGEKTGYYYYYMKKENDYDIYRSNVMNKTQKLYLFTTNDISRITYKDDKIYYIYDNLLKVYSDSLGNKTILRNDELRFNKNLNFYIY